MSNFDELVQKLDTLRKQLDALDERTSSSKTLLLEYRRLRNLIAHVTLQEPEAIKAQRDFIELCAKVDPFESANTQMAEAKNPTPHERLSLAEALSHSPAPNTKRALALHSLVRDGLRGLCDRYDESLREAQLIQSRGVVRHELASTARNLGIVKSVLDEMKEIIENCSFITQTEVVLLERDGAPAVTLVLDNDPLEETCQLLSALQVMQFDQSEKLSRIESTLRRLKLEGN